MSCYHIVPSITATMEEMPERHTYVKHPVPSITATMEEMPERHSIIQFHPLLPQWRRCQKGTCQIMVSLDILCVSIDLRE